MADGRWFDGTGLGRAFHRFMRDGLITVLVGLVVAVSIVIGPGSSTPAGATTGLQFNTKFEIDGNPQVNDVVNGGDWLSTAAQYPSLRDNIVTTPTAEPCGPGSDPTRIVQGNSLDQINVNDPSPFVEPGNVNTKDDICAVRRAWELKLVDGQYHFITYLAWSRANVQGEINVLVPILGNDPNSQSDDIVVSYDFEDNTGSTTLSFLTWDGTTWGEGTPLPAGTYEASTGSGVTDPAVPVPPGTNLTFGEYAIDLTAAGLLPEGGPCANFTSRGVVSRTGNSPSATLMDAVVMPPLTLTNCSNLQIVKQTTPTPTSPVSFGYSVSQLDGLMTPVTGSIAVPPNPNNTTINNLLISPDYVVGETSLPAGWTEQSLVCTSVDPVTGSPVTRRLFGATPPPLDTSFPLGPNVQAVCTIANAGPPSVTLTKTVDPVNATGWSFGFTISPATGVTPGAAQTVTSAAPSVTWDNLTPGTQYTITESNVPAGYQAGTISCNGGGNTFTPVAGQAVACTATNQKLATITVQKTTVGGAGGPFTLRLAGPSGGSSINRDAPISTVAANTPVAALAYTNLQPGTYTFSEPTVATGFQPGAGNYLSCTVTDSAGTPKTPVTGTGSINFAVAFGETALCTATNDKSATGQLTKVSAGGGAVFAFNIIVPGSPAGVDITVDTTTTNPNTVDLLAAINAVVTPDLPDLPFGSYTITENPKPGWFADPTIDCTVTHVGGTATISTNDFSLVAGDSVACTASNINTSYRVLGSETSVNLAGTSHTFTFSVEVDRHDGSGFVNAGAGILVNFTASPAPGTVTPASPCTTNTDGQCTVRVNNPTAGSTAVTATSIGIPGVPDGQGGSQTFVVDTPDTSQTKTWIDYTLALTPGSAVNVFPTQPTHDITVQLTGTPNNTVAPIAGQTVNLSLTSTAATITASPGGAIAANGLSSTCVTDGNGRCVITLTATDSGSATLNASYQAVGSDPADTKLVPAAPATKVWAAFRVRVTPATATNIVGIAHTVQVFVETTNDDGQTWTGVTGVNASVSISPTGATISNNTCAGPGTDINGMCIVTFNSTTPGTYTVTAVYNLIVDGQPIPIPVTGTATKIYVDYRIAVSPTTATNLVNTNHVFTVLVEKDSGGGQGFQPLAGAVPAVIQTGAGSIASQTCTAGTNATGQCTVTLTSPATGPTTLTAQYEGTAGSVDQPQTKGVSAQATKTWIDYEISVAPSATNIVGNDHVFTVTVRRDSADGNGFQPLAGAVPTLTFGPTGTFVSESCSAGTNAGGQCTVTVTSTATGQGTLTATYVGTAPGTGQAPETRPYVASATKTWIDYRISVSPTSAINLVNNPHVFTVTVEKDSGDGDGFQPLAGVSPAVSIDNGTITVNNCASPGVADSSGQCTVTVNSDTAATATITATYVGTAPGSGEVPQTKTVTAQATKAWITYQLVLTPDQAINQFPILDQRTHDITATLTGTPDNTAAPVAGQTLTLTLTSNASTITAVSPSGTIAPGGKSTTCVTDTAGRCVLTLTATGAGLALVQGSYEATVSGVSQIFDSNVARKAWVNYTVSVTPSTATNIVGFSHTVTVLTQQFDGETSVPMVGQRPVVTIAPTGGGSPITPTADGCQSSGTGAAGTCTVTFVTDTPGTYTITAVNNVRVTVGETQVEIPVSSTASKTYVDYQITMSADSTNPAGSPHTFTVTVQKNSGDGQGFQPLAGAVPTISTSAFGGTITNGCIAGTDAQGQCPVTVNSNNAASVTVTAAYTGTAGSETKTVTADATKTWIVQNITNIRVTKAANTSGLAIAAGQTTATLTWTVTVTNTTDIPAENVVAVDTLPTPWTFSSYDGNGQFTCSVSGQTVTCNATPGTLPGNATSSFTITATAPTPSLSSQSPIVNAVQVSTTSGETTLVDNASSVATPVSGPPVIVPLPETGTDLSSSLRLGSLLTFAGVGFLLMGRRRKRAA